MEGGEETVSHSHPSITVCKLQFGKLSVPRVQKELKKCCSSKIKKKKRKCFLYNEKNREQQISPQNINIGLYFDLNCKQTYSQV